MATFSSPLASAASVPGVSGRCSVAARAVAVRRGSETISVRAARPGLVEPLHQRRHRFRRVAAADEHRIRAADVGHREREPAVEPNARVRRAAAPDMRTGRYSRYSRCPAPPGRTCPAGTSSRWSAAGPEHSRTASLRHASSCIAPDARSDPVERLVPARRSQRAGGFVSRAASAWSVGRGEDSRAAAGLGALAAQAALVRGEVARSDRPHACVLREPASCRIAGRNRGNACRCRTGRVQAGDGPREGRLSITGQPFPGVRSCAATPTRPALCAGRRGPTKCSQRACAHKEALEDRCSHGMIGTSRHRCIASRQS